MTRIIQCCDSVNVFGFDLFFFWQLDFGMIYEVTSEIVVYHVYFFNIYDGFGDRRNWGVRGMTNGGMFVQVCEKIIAVFVCLLCKFMTMDWVSNDLYVAYESQYSTYKRCTLISTNNY